MKNTNKQEQINKIDSVMLILRDFYDTNELNPATDRMIISALDTLRRAKYNADKVICYNCGDVVEQKTMKRWYHADQDDMVCIECAKKLTHTDTCYAGTPVYREEAN